MKRALLLTTAVLVILSLAACSGEVTDKAYPASGDSNNPSGLTENDGQFGSTDDLNVIVQAEHSPERGRSRSAFL